MKNLPETILRDSAPAAKGGPPDRERWLLGGPCPPPWHGTSVGFDLFVEYVRRHSSARVQVINLGGGGSKAGLALWSPRMLREALVRTWALARAQWSCRKVVIHGSARFISACAVCYVFILTRLLRKQVFLYVNGGNYDSYLATLRPAERRIVLACLRLAKAVVVETQCSYRVLREHLHNLAVVSNWRRPPRAQNAAPSRSPGRVRFIYVGRVCRAKGMAELLAAFRAARSRLLDCNIEATLDLYGPIAADLRGRIAREVSLPGSSVRSHGERDHEVILTALVESDVFVFPTRYFNEGHSGAVIEAMSLGLPVVATRWRAAEELLEDGVNGLLCEAGDDGALADALCAIASSPELRRGMSAHARSSAARFDSDTVLEHLCAVYGLPLTGDSLRGRAALVQSWPGIFVHARRGEVLWASRGFQVLCSRDEGLNWVAAGALRQPWLARCLVANTLTRRLLRLGVRAYVQLTDDSFLAFAGGQIYYGQAGARRLQPVARLERGRAPMRQGCCSDNNGGCYYAEYWRNLGREPDHLYHWRPGWPAPRRIFTFSGIRHIHAVQMDPVGGKLWVATGDRDNESIIGYFEGSAERLQFVCVASGSQDTRAVSLIFTEEYVYWGSDAGSDTDVLCNYVFRWSRSDGRVQRILKVHAPVFYSQTDQDRILLCTVVERSRSEVDNRVHLWARTVSDPWREVATWKKDLYPTLFGYGCAWFPEGALGSDRIYVVTEALAPYDGTWVFDTSSMLGGVE